VRRERLVDVAERDVVGLEVGHFDADGGLAGDRRLDADVGGGERVGEVVLEAGDAAHLDARRQLQLVSRDAGTGHGADDVGLDVEVPEGLDESLGHRLDGLRGLAPPRLHALEEAGIGRLPDTARGSLRAQGERRLPRLRDVFDRRGEVELLALVDRADRLGRRRRLRRRIRRRRRRDEDLGRVVDAVDQPRARGRRFDLERLIRGERRDDGGGLMAIDHGRHIFVGAHDPRRRLAAPFAEALGARLRRPPGMGHAGARPLCPEAERRAGDEEQAAGPQGDDENVDPDAADEGMEQSPEGLAREAAVVLHVRIGERPAGTAAAEHAERIGGRGEQEPRHEHGDARGHRAPRPSPLTGRDNVGDVGKQERHGVRDQADQPAQGVAEPAPRRSAVPAEVKDEGEEHGERHAGDRCQLATTTRRRRRVGRVRARGRAP